MKKAIIVTVIVVVSVCVGFFWTFTENFITEKTHPMEYSEYVEKYSDMYAVPQEIIYAVIKCESSFEADAKSKSGAVGLMQVMPSTFEEICRDLGEECVPSSLYDPEVNIKSGTFYLSKLYRKYGIWETVYAAYNAGYGNVDKWLKNTEYGKDGRLSDIPFSETEEYVKRVSKARQVYSGRLGKDNQKVEAVIPEKNS